MTYYATLSRTQMRCFRRPRIAFQNNTKSRTMMTMVVDTSSVSAACSVGRNQRLANKRQGAHRRYPVLSLPSLGPSVGLQNARRWEWGGRRSRNASTRWQCFSRSKFQLKSHRGIKGASDRHKHQGNSSPISLDRRCDALVL